MRSDSLARVVIASLGVFVVIAPGCGKSPAGPSAPFSVLSISPTEGSSDGATTATITGTGFIIIGQGGATVTVDGSPVNASPSPDGKTISLVMPAHAAGKVDVNVTAPLSQAQASVPGGYTYLPLPPPAISELRPNTGSTAGGTPMIIIGAGFRFPVTVSVGGIATPFEYDDFGVDVLYLTTPAHAAGTVEVIVTNPDGRTASGLFTYASPAAFDLNGEWQGWAQALAPPDLGARLVLTIRDNIAVSVRCSVCRPNENCATVSAPSLMLDPPPVVANGEFSFDGSGGVITGKILSPTYASGSLNLDSCGSRQWWAEKK